MGAGAIDSMFVHALYIGTRRSSVASDSAHRLNRANSRALGVPERLPRWSAGAPSALECRSAFRAGVPERAGGENAGARSRRR